MTIYELADEYDKQYAVLNAHIQGLSLLLSIYTGENLLGLRKKIKTYYDMACDCRRTAEMLRNYYEEED